MHFHTIISYKQRIMEITWEITYENNHSLNARVYAHVSREATCLNVVLSLLIHPYSKPVLSSYSKKQILVFKTNYRLMQVKSMQTRRYCRMLQESILQYLRPSLSCHLSLRPLFCLFLSCRNERSGGTDSSEPSLLGCAISTNFSITGKLPYVG